MSKVTDPEATVGSPNSAASLRAAGGVLREDEELGSRYRIGKLLGRGGMGEVYAAYDRELDRQVALKTIQASLSMDSAVLERFKREIRLSTQVTHKNVLRVFDFAEADGLRFLTMQYVDGESLQARLQAQGKLPLPELLELARPIARGIAAAHELGVVHRDLKPHNVLIERTGAIYVADFGLAVSAGQASVTQTGEMLGSPSYMSPEQVSGEPIDARSDVYSFGVILFRMATGTLPFKAGTPFETMMRRVNQDPQPTREAAPEVAPELANVIDRCLQRSVERRYPSAVELLADLDAIVLGQPMPSARNLPDLEPSRSEMRRPAPASETAPTAPAAAFTTTRRRPQAIRATALIAAVVFTVVACVVGWRQRRANVPALTAALAPPPAIPSGTPSKPVRLLVVDIVNQTGEPTFDGAFEQPLRCLLADAVTVAPTNFFDGRAAFKKHAGDPGGADAAWTATALDVGAAGVLRTTVSKAGAGYGLTLRVVEPKSGSVWFEKTGSADSADALVNVMADAAIAVREQFGDTSSADEKTRAARAFRGRPVAALVHYAEAVNLHRDSAETKAVHEAEAAIAADANFGLAYLLEGVGYANLDRGDDAERAYRLGFSHQDAIPDQSLLQARGTYFIQRHEGQKAVEVETQVVERFPADEHGLYNLAVAYFIARDMKQAERVGREASEKSPSDASAMGNLALLAAYAGDFDVAQKRAHDALGMHAELYSALAAIALADVGLGHMGDAHAAYDRLAAVGPSNASVAAMGQADLALYEGKLRDGERLLRDGIAVDLAAGANDAASVKTIALAEVELALGQRARALIDADHVTISSKDLATLVPGARVYIAAHEDRKATAIATSLAKRVAPDAQAYAELIRGELLLARGHAREALSAFEGSLKVADLWLGRLDTARAYIELELYPEAATELDTCQKRRGEALALFLDEVPTARYWPDTLYYIARAKQGLGSGDAHEAYEAFLAIRPSAEKDDLTRDAKKRAKLP